MGRGGGDDMGGEAEIRAQLCPNGLLLFSAHISSLMMLTPLMANDAAVLPWFPCSRDSVQHRSDIGLTFVSPYLGDEG